ncbi:MAG: Lsr2 family protein [Actinomycetota bacterium]|nr:Lsr2 family protein [Actinomycetota bacterium]
MAERVTVELVDDLDGSVADETVHFTWEGKSLVVDLNKKNADKLRKAIGPFVAAARPDGTVPAPAPRRRVSSSSSSGKRRDAGSGAATSVIRAWARENSIEVPDRGRLKPDVIQAWEAAGKPEA